MLSAATACLARCAGCSRCNYITISLEWQHCSWHNVCQHPLLEDAPNFISGAARKQLHGARNSSEEKSRRGVAQKKRDLLGHVSRVRYSFERCPKGAAPPATADVDYWTDGVRTSFLAGYAALHHAACCGGVGVLPRISPEQSERALAHSSTTTTMAGLLGPRTKACFTFEHLPSVAESSDQCEPRRESAQFFLDRGIHGTSACPSSQYYSHPVMHAFLEYLRLPETLTCPSTVDFTRTLVVHVRSGETHENDFEDNPDQPPVSYFLSAWAASKLEKLLVVAQSDDTPVLRVLHMMGDALHGGPRSISIMQGQGLNANLAALMCARHLAVSRSSWHALLLMNERLETVYSPVPIVHAMTNSCKTSIQVPSFRDGPGASGAWLSPSAQRLDLVMRNWNQTIKFKQQREPRVQCLHAPAAS